MSENASTLFERIGGTPGVALLVEHFYAAMDGLPQARTIRALHAADLAPVKAVLTDYFTQWLGGPAIYSEQRGHPRLRQRHMGFPIDEAARDAWMACMDRALEETVADPALRAALREPMAPLADWMRNKAG